MRGSKKGITLISLVVTIIVLLILAGISISLVTGDNGVLTRAKDANTAYKISSAKEQATMKVASYLSEYMDKTLFEKNSTTGTMTAGEYIISQINGKVDGNFGYSVSGNTLSIIDTATGEILATGTIGEKGELGWSDSAVIIASNGNNNSNSGNTSNTGNGRNTVDDSSAGIAASPTVTGNSNNNVTSSTVAGNSNNNNTAGTASSSSSAGGTVENLAKAGTIKRWDKINYNPGNGTTTGLTMPSGASIVDDMTYSPYTISASDSTDWRILDVNQTTGEVLIMPRSVSSIVLKLDGIEGYTNSISALDAIAGIYLNSTYATNSRSIRIEDINKVENHTPNGIVAEYSWNHRYGMDQNLNVLDAGEGNSISRTYTSTATTGLDNYDVPSFTGMRTFWIASRLVYVDRTDFDFLLPKVKNAKVKSVPLVFLYINGSTTLYDEFATVIPVVTLKPEVRLDSNSTFYTTSETSPEVSEQATGYVHNVWTIN